jgi:hypothetical protein
LWQFLKLAPAQGREGGDLSYGLILIKVVAPRSSGAPRSSVMEMKPPDRSEVHGNAVAAPVAWPIVVAQVRGKALAAPVAWPIVVAEVRG